MSIRDEAVLRELNLYPLWVRRNVPLLAAEIKDQDTSAQREVLTSEPIAKAHFEPQISPSILIESEKIETVLHPQKHEDADWPELRQQVHGCSICKLRATCTQTVFGAGDEKAEWLFVGEGPGAEEDVQGEPFVGQAGKLLDNMLAAIKLKRGRNVYIANVVKCRPPNDRNPEADEIAQCMPYLQRQVALIQPKIIVALGKTAASALLGHDAALGSLRGSVHQYQGIPLIITYHPAYLLRSPAEKAKAWQDLCFAVATHSA
jgi:DNA polymerase